MSNTATLNFAVDFVTRVVTVISPAPLPIGSDVWCDVNFTTLNDSGSNVALATGGYTVGMTLRQYAGGPVLATNSNPAAAEGSVLYGLYLPLSGAALLEALKDAPSGNLIAEIQWTMANPYTANLGPSTITTRSQTFNLPFALVATSPEAAEGAAPAGSTLGGGSSGSSPTVVAQFLSQAGGGGGSAFGGGGAGGYKSSSISLTRGTVYAVAVGVGGSGASGSTNGENGGNSGIVGIDSTITHGGGGGGGAGSPGGLAGSDGGSGGGGGANALASGVQGPGGSGISGEGFAGGYSPGGGYSPSGGGGGAGGSGSSPGAGGPGVTSLITGSLQTYGVGGNGSSYGGAISPAGAAGTGNGGGGGSTGTAGGSGTFILSVPVTQYSGNYTGSPTISLVGLNVVLQWLAGGSYTA